MSDPRKDTFVRRKLDGKYGVVRFRDGPMALIAFAGEDPQHYDLDEFEEVHPGEVVVQDVMGS